jgi:hypothetical protein
MNFGLYESSRYEFEIEETRTPIYVVGSPNMGKSTLLGNLTEQFAVAGDGILVIDIKGDLAKDIVARTSFPDRTIYVKAGGISFPDGVRFWTFNPFEGHRTSAAVRQQLSSSVLEAFERMGRAQLGIMANIRGTLMHAIDIALTQESPTLLDLYMLIVDQDWRIHKVTNQKYVGHITRRHWLDLDHPKTPARERRQQTNSTRNRLEALLTPPEMNLTLGSYRSTLRLKEWLDQGKTIVVDLGLPMSRELGVDWGNLLLSQFTAESYLRTDRTRTWRVIVDEFHEFAGRQFAEIITDTRSFNVFPVLAHQDRGQLPREFESPLRGALGHAGITVHLRGSREDRVALASLFGKDIADQIYGLKRHRAFIEYFDSLADRPQSEIIVLHDWWASEVPGQLAEAQMRAHEFTVPKHELVAHNRATYWDYLNGKPHTNAGRSAGPETRAGATTKVPPRPESGETVSGGSTAGPSGGDSRPGVARPARAVDQRNAAGSAVPRPPRSNQGRESGQP